MIYWDIEQGTEEWHRLRLGIPTASEFSKLVTPAKMEPSKQLDDFALVLAAEAYSMERVDAWAGNDYTDHGHAAEDAARAFYSMVTGRSVQVAGFVRSDVIEAGMSPDGLLLDYDEILEIKCCGAKQHIRALSMTECPRDYMAQAQGEILAGWGDGIRRAKVLMYSETLPAKVFHVEPIQKFQDLLKQQIEKVCQERDRYLKIIQEAA